MRRAASRRRWGIGPRCGPTIPAPVKRRRARGRSCMSSRPTKHCRRSCGRVCAAGYWRSCESKPPIRSPPPSPVRYETRCGSWGYSREEPQNGAGMNADNNPRNPQNRDQSNEQDTDKQEKQSYRSGQQGQGQQNIQYKPGQGGQGGQGQGGMQGQKGQQGQGQQGQDQYKQGQQGGQQGQGQYKQGQQGGQQGQGQYKQGQPSGQQGSMNDEEEEGDVEGKDRGRDKFSGEQQR